ncbi:hypothetical protein B0H13DRAFT_1920544 [Mycena leptocephala]|nr:hypothetical protein B0H13DRAFT_1920544 [Mycena leptocephala]
MSDSNKIRYHAEHYFRAPMDISLACLSPSAGLLALSRRSRISLHPVPKFLPTANRDEQSLSVYTQDGPCDVTALVWLTEKVFVAGYVDGTVVFTLAFKAGLSVFVPLLDELPPSSDTPVRGSWQSSRTWTFNSGRFLRLSYLFANTVLAASLTLGIFLGLPKLPNPSTSVGLIICEWDTRRSSLAPVTHLEPNLELKGVSWDGRYRLHGTQHLRECHLTHTDTMTGNKTFFNFPTPRLEDQDFLASFVHHDKLVLVASSYKIVLWDPSKSHLTLQEFRHLTKGPGSNSPKLKTISAVSRVHLTKLVHTFVIDIASNAAKEVCSDVFVTQLNRLKEKWKTTALTSISGQEALEAYTRESIQKLEQVLKEKLAAIREEAGKNNTDLTDRINQLEQAQPQHAKKYRSLENKLTAIAHTASREVTKRIDRLCEVLNQVQSTQMDHESLFDMVMQDLNLMKADVVNVVTRCQELDGRDQAQDVIDPFPDPWHLFQNGKSSPISVHNILGLPIAEDAENKILQQLLPTLAVEMGLSLCEDLRFIDGEGRAQESDAIRGFTNIEGLEQKSEECFRFKMQESRSSGDVQRPEPTHEGGLQLVRFKPEESRSGGCNQLRIIPRVDAIRGFANIEGLEHEGCFRFKMQESRSSGDVERPEPTHEGGLQLIQFKAQESRSGGGEQKPTHEGGLQLIRFKPQESRYGGCNRLRKIPGVHVIRGFADIEDPKPENEEALQMVVFKPQGSQFSGSLQMRLSLAVYSLAVGVLLLALGRELQKAEMEAYYEW